MALIFRLNFVSNFNIDYLNFNYYSLLDIYLYEYLTGSKSSVGLAISIFSYYGNFNRSARVLYRLVLSWGIFRPQKKHKVFSRRSVVVFIRNRMKREV